MSEVLVDSNILLDVISGDPEWGAWSAKALVECAESSELAINPLIYAEVSVRFERIEELDMALPEALFRRDPLRSPTSTSEHTRPSGG